MTTQTLVSDKKLTAREAAAALGLQESTIRRWVLTRRINVFRIGRSIRIAESEVARILQEGLTPARPRKAQ